MDDIWDDEPVQNAQSHAEWTKMSSDFTNTGYREGITAGKEGALQEGFDAGFAQIGVPLGRELGNMRGIASVLVAFLSQSGSPLLDEARTISTALNSVRFADIAPRDLEAEEHARQHLETEGEEVDVPEEIDDKRKMEGLEDMLNKLSSGALNPADHSRPTMADVTKLKTRLENLVLESGLNINWS
ncbi:hypothetical protein CYLTODRAFT_437252 [Cylindrobasidium torrendii FP15055 ss-10]|uniref:Protein YAE1 n=1 Tax=Cylindrobasidium torrendii FP15055 ss-10 TaxID=1314674 RepID=A0A0D7B9T1_9AGAR|nr:hypothetical protein CYLTODRAFT_437252 [Cylindrobasidium torrendii FP15055 ss-10]